MFRFNTIRVTSSPANNQISSGSSDLARETPVHHGDPKLRHSRTGSELNLAYKKTLLEGKKTSSQSLKENPFARAARVIHDEEELKEDDNSVSQLNGDENLKLARNDSPL
jgi:hypothetical protein